MAEDVWKTIRKCPKCWNYGQGKEVYLWAQKWGWDDEGPVIKLDCRECGHHEPLTHWKGH